MDSNTLTKPKNATVAHLSDEASNRLPILAEEIKRAHAGVEAAVKIAAEHALEAGRGLIEAKALLKHGEWLPWLKKNVGFSRRTAQLYMRIVELGFKSTTVADMGLQAAANAMMVITDDAYDPFFGNTDLEIKEWLLFMIFLGREDHMGIQAACEHVEWLLQGKDTFPLNAWLGEEGERWRRIHCYRSPKHSPRFLRAWKRFLEKNKRRTRKNIEAELNALGRAEEEAAPERHRFKLPNMQTTRFRYFPK
jgi:Protein of unknown function (DUF3102)